MNTDRITSMHDLLNCEWRDGNCICAECGESIRAKDGHWVHTNDHLSIYRHSARPKRVATPTPAENRIWILKPRVFDADGMPDCVASWREWERDNPWDSKYNKVFGFVIEAATEQDARAIADNEAGAENEHSHWPHPWLNQGITVCEELTPTGMSRVVLTDFYED